MFHWKENYKWNFSDLGSADRVGINEAGIGIFKRQPYKGLTKEILQNVTDVPDPNLPDDVPVKAKFELIYIDKEDIPDFDRLREVIHKCYDYYPDGDDGKKLRRLKDSADKYLSGDEKIPVLKISDYNTRGARGVREKRGSDWSGLVRERSATNKSNDSSGAFGVGKFAPFNFTAIRTVFYSTKTIDNEYAFQGKAILTTFEEDGIEKQNIGLFGENGGNFDAVFDPEDVAPVFRRNEFGTDIFVLAFEREDDWVEQSAISVLEYFFYSIYKGKLEVEIKDGDKDVKINRSNLGDMIGFYDKCAKDYMEDDPAFQFTTPRYWNLLNDPKCSTPIMKPFMYKGKSMGNYELYLLTGDEIEDRRALEMRQAGMKIREDTSFKLSMNFTAIFIATGEGAISQEPDDNISSFLRKCENQAHDDWTADEYKEEKVKAKGIIKQVHQIILDAAKEKMPDYGEESVDAFGLSEFLPNEEEDDDQKEEMSFSNFSPLSFEIQSVKRGKKRKQLDISMRKNGGSKHKKKPEKEKREKKYHKEPNNKRGTGKGTMRETSISNIKTPFNVSQGEYQISFISDKDVDDMVIDIKIGADDDNFTKADIAQAMMHNRKVKVKDGTIELGPVYEGEKNIMFVKLKDKERKTMEVSAYAKS